MQKRGQDRERTTDRGKERQGKGERRGEIERREEISDNIYSKTSVKQRVSEGEEKLRRRSISSAAGDENRRKEVDE